MPASAEGTMNSSIAILGACAKAEFMNRNSTVAISLLIVSPLSGTADGQSIDSERGLADADRYALAFLAAGADARVERQIVADNRDPCEGVGSVADERCALHRVGHLAVLDHERLGRREDELAARDIDLPAAEIGGV